MAKPPASKKAAPKKPAKPVAPRKKRAATPARDPETGLTLKQRHFADEYLIDLNGARAYRAAGFAGSDNVCAVEAHKLLRNPKVQIYLEKARAERIAAVKLDAQNVLARLHDEVEADIADLYDDDGGLKPVHLWPLVWRKGLVSSIEVEEVFEREGDKRVHVGNVRKIRISDRLKRIELIGKHVGVQAFKERVELDTAEDLAARLQRARERAIGGG